MKFSHNKKILILTLLTAIFFGICSLFANSISKETLFGQPWHNGSEMGGASLEFNKDGTVKYHDDFQGTDTMGKWTFEGKDLVTTYFIYPDEKGVKKEVATVYKITFENTRDKDRYCLRGKIEAEGQSKEPFAAILFMKNWLNEQN